MRIVSTCPPSSISIAASLVLALAASAWADSAPASVVGGREAKPGDWPDVVAIVGADGGLCSGTLLAADLVLTAGHCIDMRPTEVIVGSVDLARPGGDRRAVKWSRAYPRWLDRYDVGVVMLEHPVFAKQRAVAQDCSASGRLVAGLPLEVVGFGLTTKAGTDDNTRLHRATIPVVDPTCARDPACAPAIAPGGEFTAGGDGVDACFGDSGGPVYIATAKGPALFGIVSRGVSAIGNPCENGGVYVRADKVVAWVQSVTDRRLDRVPCVAPTSDGGDTPADGDLDALHDGSDGDGRSDEATAGCNAAGAMGSGFALYYAALVILGLRRRRGAQIARR